MVIVYTREMQRFELRDAIEEEIARGTFAPGEHLDEVALAARYGVSRTPVREALMQLSAIGLVVSRPRRGVVVARPRPDELIEMFEVMAELEGMAGRLAARRATADDLKRLRETHGSCVRAAAAADADEYYYENERFHDAIYTASRSSFLRTECIELSKRLKPYRRLQLRVPHRVAQSLAEHGAIIEAIAEGDGAKAQQRLRDHVVVQGDRFADLIASLRELEASALSAAAARR
jgi:DNA-binding GntR family transcriptional regulator